MHFDCNNEDENKSTIFNTPWQWATAMVCITYANYHASEQWYFSTTHISAVFNPIRKILESMNYTSFWMNVKCLKIHRNQSCVFDNLKARIKN